MLNYRVASKLIAAGCLVLLMSGCITSIKSRRGAQPAPQYQEYQPSSEPALAPIPTGAPPAFEPAPLPTVPPPPSSANIDLGTKTTAMFRTASTRMKSVFVR
jgi:hypothetical protein